MLVFFYTMLETLKEDCNPPKFPSCISKINEALRVFEKKNRRKPEVMFLELDKKDYEMFRKGNFCIYMWFAVHTDNLKNEMYFCCLPDKLKLEF